MALSMAQKSGRLAYGLVFTVVLPAGLWVWNSRLACGLPPVHSLWAGAALIATGGLCLVLGMWGLWRDGGGLPMNVYPPPRLVIGGIYAWLPHPIYTGFVALCAGVALASGSATGLWIVTPVVALGCLALVVGYEGPDLRRRFASGSPAPWLGMPPVGDGPVSLRRRVGAMLAVLVPWALAYAAVKALGVPVDAFETRLDWEWGLPVWPVTMPIYASVYLVVPLTFLTCREPGELRRLVAGGWLATVFNTLVYLVVPATAVFRAGETSGWLGQWLAWEQHLARPAAGSLPSFHVAWAVLCTAVLVRGPWRRTRILGWGWCAALALSCLTTGMHSVADVVTGALSGALCVRPERRWQQLLAVTERLSNGWRSWQFGPLRVINHGLWSGLAGLAVLLVAGMSAAPEHLGWVFLVALCGLLGAGLWAQWVEGSSALLRPFGYYGAVLGCLLAMAATALCRGPVTDLLVAFAVAAPWAQALGRLRCIVQGCCHGRPVPWGIRVTNPHSRVVKLAGFTALPIHPTPLYSILGNVVIGLLLLRLRMINTAPFVIAGGYLLLAGLSRFAEEAYRGEPQTATFAGLALYQWMAIGSLALGMVLMALPGAPLQPWHAPGALLGAGALCWGLVCAFAMSMDFPDSHRRFSRLTG